MPRPLVATIHLSALRHNLAVAKKHAPHSKVWAIVKANAYGHGLENGMNAFATADGLGLIELENAVRLREMGWQKPVLLLEGFFEVADIALLNHYQLDTVVHCVEQIEMLEAAYLPTSLNISLKMNTGMNRLGFMPSDYAAAHRRLRAISAIRNITLITHFANGDDALSEALPVAEQIRRFKEATAGQTDLSSLANSAGALLHHDVAAADWIRPGIMLYGGTPGSKTAEEFGLLPGMTLTGEIIAIQNLNRGDTVGYGSRFIAHQATRIGVVSCGYADGYPRHAPNGTPILVDGSRAHIAGRVSMDMITIDITHLPTAHIGSAVTLWGQGLPIDEVAQASGTIGYELMCALTARVKVITEAITTTTASPPDG